MSKVIIFGSVNLDLVTRVKSHPIPGETVIGSDYETFPGGKGANQALAAAKILDDPMNVTMIGATGKDAFAEIALSNLKKSCLDLSCLKRVDKNTGVALIAVDEKGENNIIVCPGANSLARALQLSTISLSSRDVLLTQQEIPMEEIWSAHSIAKRSGAIVVHNAAPASSIPRAAFQNIDYLIINASEAISLGNALNLKDGDAKTIAIEIARQFGVAVILTLGEKGVVSIIVDREIHYPAIAVDVVDTTGAGDVFCGTFAASIASRLSLIAAIENSIVAASKACSTFGAQSLDK